MRAKLRAEWGDPLDAVAHFERSVRDKRYANEAAARYGLVSALLRARSAQAAAARSRACAPRALRVRCSTRWKRA